MAYKREQHGPWPEEQILWREQCNKTRYNQDVYQQRKYSSVPRRRSDISTQKTTRMVPPENYHPRYAAVTEEVQPFPWKQIIFGAIVMLLALSFLQSLISTVTIKVNEMRYESPMITQYDFYVGHDGEDLDHKTHFMALNYHGKIIIFEIHQNPSETTVYYGPILLNQGSENYPVYLSLYGNKNILVQCSSNTYHLLNDGKKFTFEEMPK